MARSLSLLSQRNLSLPIFRSLCSVFNSSLNTYPYSSNYFLYLLPFCRKSQDVKALNSLLIVHGLIEELPLLKQFIERCCHLGFPDVALTAFKTIEKPSLYLQNLILRCLCDNGFFENVLLVYRMCQSCGSVSDNYTYPFVIKACAALGEVCLGGMMHSVVLRTGFVDNLVVQTAMVDFYSKIGEMKNACKMFDEIPHPDLAAWNALVSGYSVNGLYNEVFQVFRNMNAKGVKPNAVTFTSMIPVCSRFDFTSNFGISLHGLAYKLGLSEVENLTPALISMYANHGDLIGARSIFDIATKTNVAIWNAMISCYMRNQELENAVAVFRTMLSTDMEPDKVTFVSLLPSSENLGSIWYVDSWYAYAIKLGFEKQPIVTTAILSLYAKLGDIDSAEFLFRAISQRNRLLWNSMVSAYAGNGLSEKSLEAFRGMQNNGFNPDSISIISLLSSCAELQASRLGRLAHAFSLKEGMTFDPNLSNSLLAFYCDSGALAYSFEIFNKMVERTVVSWNTMISGCINNGESERAMLLFQKMLQEGVGFDFVTLVSILSACQNSMLGLAIHSYGVKTAIISEISLANALISMYIRCGDLNAARTVFDEMPYTSVVSYNAILTGYRYNNLQKEAFDLFVQMIDEGQKPDYITCLNLLLLCTTYFHGKSVQGYVFRRMIPLETPLLTSLMIMYARFENLTSSLILFRMGDKRSASLWNAVMSAHLLTGNSSMAFFFFRGLLRDKVGPDEATALNLVSACGQMKNLHISDLVLSYLVRKGWDKDLVVSNALIDMYAKCGNISTARILFDLCSGKDTVSWNLMINGYGLHGDAETVLSLYSKMRVLGFKPDKATYISVLSACSHAGLVEQGRMVFESLIHDGVSPDAELYACMVDLLGRTGHLNEAYEIIKGFPYKAPNVLESLLGACLNHGDYGLGEEIGRLLLETKPRVSGPYVMLYNAYAASGKWLEADKVRLTMEQRRFTKAPGISLLDGDMLVHEQRL